MAKAQRPVRDRVRMRRTQPDELVVTSQTELVFKVDGHVKSLDLASNSHRVLVERTLANDLNSNNYFDAFSLEKALSEERPNGFGVELWNIEFADARLESFSKEKIGLLASTLNCAAFDESGERLFWTTREAKFSTPTATTSTDALSSPIVSNVSNKIVRSAAPDVNLEALEIPEFPETALSSDVGVSSSLPQVVVPVVDSRNVVLTKPLETRSFMHDVNGSATETDVETKHMKTSDEVYNAGCVWLSPKAQWLVARLQTSSEGKDETLNNDWALVLLRDKRRVVRFPAKVKMTFDSLTSDETIEGRIVDVLAVSDEGDLVATLVEEEPKIETDGSKDDSVGFSNYEGTFDLSSSLRYKIAIWDLNVAKTVDFDKAKKPLTALEVSQITLTAPIARHFCKFSPTGDRFAARVAPKYVTVWQSANGRVAAELGEHQEEIRDFNFAPKSAKMIVGTGGKRAQAVLWEIRKGIVYRTLDDFVDQANSIDAVVFSNDEKYVYFANNYGEIKRWDVAAK